MYRKHEVRILATRRGVTFGDRAALRRLLEQSKLDSYRLANLVEGLVTDDLFRRR